MSVKVTVKVFAMLRDLMEREQEIDLEEGATISRLLEFLIGRYPALYGELFDAPGVFKRHVNVLKNGRNISFLKDMETVIEDGDTVAIFPPVAGG